MVNDVATLIKVAEHKFCARCLLMQFSARTRIAKYGEHAVNRAIILSNQHRHHQCHFSLELNAVY